MSASSPIVQIARHDKGEPHPLVSATELRKWYFRPNGARIDVLDRISLNVKPRRVVSLIGPSGSGKSTLLRLLASVEKPSDGSIIYHYSLDGTLPPIPMVFQSPAVLPWRTVRQNIALGLELLGKRNNESDVEIYIERTGLSGFADFLPKDLSGGMKARVSIARALVAATEFVLFDEAFTELDEVTRQAINDIFCEHVEIRGLSAVVVSHDIAEAAYLGDEVVILTKRPARIARTYSVDLPRPRVPALRSTPEFEAAVHPLRQFASEIWR